VSKLEKYIDGITDVHVTLSAEKYRQIAEINVHSRGKLYLSAKEASADLKTSVQQALEKIAGQAKKKQEKRIDRKRRAVKAAEAEGTFALIAADGGPPGSPRIIESHDSSSTPERRRGGPRHRGAGGEFLVFRNARTTDNVLYRRPDGNFGSSTPNDDRRTNAERAQGANQVSCVFLAPCPFAPAFFGF
jgi:putative sigma-54 modulation protein